MLQGPKYRILFDIFEIMFRKTTEDTEGTEGAKEKNNNFLHPSAVSAVKFPVWLRMRSGSSNADIAKSHDGVLCT